MASQAQDLIDRRRLRRKLGFWRVLAVVIVVGVAIAVGIAGGLFPGSASGAAPQIARVAVEGLITEDEKLLDLLDDLRRDDAVEAVVVTIDTPGGTTAGGEALYEAVRAIGAEKPVVAEVGTLAASAGYMIAVGADRIVARRTSIVGSIGVLFQYADARKLMNTIGVDIKAIKSSPLKAEPSPFNEALPEARAMIEAMIMDTYDWFVAVVAERRGLSADRMRRLADGSVFTGRQGLENGLVDTIGGEPEVRAYLESERGIEPGLRIVEREPASEGYGLDLFARASAGLYRLLGLDPAATSLPDAIAREAGQLDGLVSLWQPQF